MEIEQKRIIDNECEQAKKCYKCRKLFWAKAYYDSWEGTCVKCKILLEKQEVRRQKRIKTKGCAIKGSNGILGWKLGNEELININYQFSKEFRDINVSNIDDKIREIKRKNIGKEITIKWGIIPFEILLGFIFCSGYYQSLLKKKFEYMGITHIKDIKTDFISIDIKPTPPQRIISNIKEII